MIDKYQIGNTKSARFECEIMHKYQIGIMVKYQIVIIRIPDGHLLCTRLAFINNTRLAPMWYQMTKLADINTRLCANLVVNYQSGIIFNVPDLHRPTKKLNTRSVADLVYPRPQCIPSLENLDLILCVDR